MSEIRSRTSSQARGQSRLRSQSGAVRNENGDETATESRVPDASIARQARDQLVSTIQQGQQVSIEAAQSWVETLALLPLLPLRQMPKVPGFRALPMGGVEAMTRFFFDVAADLLNAQREYTLAMVRLFASDEPV